MSKCKENIELVHGTCPCKDPTYVLWDNWVKNVSCFLCKNGYDRSNNKYKLDCQYDNYYECQHVKKIFA